MLVGLGCQTGVDSGWVVVEAYFCWAGRRVDSEVVANRDIVRATQSFGRLCSGALRSSSPLFLLTLAAYSRFFICRFFFCRSRLFFFAVGWRAPGSQREIAAQKVKPGNAQKSWTEMALLLRISEKRL